MFLASSAISQFVYSLGGSGFLGVNGSMMIEVMPFLHMLVTIVNESLPNAPDEVLLSNIVVSYALSTLMTGLVFLVLGFSKLGSLTSFFPRHILIVGCWC